MRMPFHKAGKRSQREHALVPEAERDLLRLGRDEIA